MCVMKQKLMFENFEYCLFNNKTVYRSQERFRSYYHIMYTEEVNKCENYSWKNYYEIVLQQ